MMEALAAAMLTFGHPEVVATLHGPMPTGVTVSHSGRVFVNFPRWGDDVPFTVAELRNGKPVAFPDEAINRPDGDPGKHFISVQSVVVDAKGRLWVLDTAAPEFKPVTPGGPKLVCIGLTQNKVLDSI